jgi:predicted NAD/FAD-dependent oxidoreductase
MPHVLIVGAGITGLSAARVLLDAGWSVRLLDKGVIPGGRLATRWISNHKRLVDVGAQFFTTRDPSFAAQVATWEQHGWVKFWCDGIPLLTSSGLEEKPDGFPRYIGSHGMDELVKQLSQGLDLRASTTVTNLKRTADGWKVSWVSGDAHIGTSTGSLATEQADAVLLTQPAPQIIHLLSHAGLPLPAGLAKIRYDPCVAVMVDVPQPRPSAHECRRRQSGPPCHSPCAKRPPPRTSIRSRG